MLKMRKELAGSALVSRKFTSACGLSIIIKSDGDIAVTTVPFVHFPNFRTRSIRPNISMQVELKPWQYKERMLAQGNRL
jgi:hypothetical protein